MSKKNIIIAVIMLGIGGGAYFAGTHQALKSEGQTNSQNNSGVIEKTASSKPNGKIAFLGTGGIHLIDSDGKNEIVLAAGSCPVWSPDGKKIVYADISNNLWNLSVVNIDGSNKKQLAVGSSDRRPFCYNYAVWSPDGQKIVFNDGLYGIDDSRSFLQLIDANGANLIKIADSNWSEFGYNADFSPDRKRIAFCRYAHDGGDTKINLISVDGTGKEEIANSGCSAQMKWSIDIDKTLQIDLDEESALSPDGKRIAYIDDHDLHVANIDGTQNTKIYGLCYTRPSWSPDGSQIACNCLENDATGIIVMNSDGTEAKKIVNTIEMDVVAVWSPQ